MVDWLWCCSVVLRLVGFFCPPPLSARAHCPAKACVDMSLTFPFWCKDSKQPTTNPHVPASHSPTPLQPRGELYEEDTLDLLSIFSPSFYYTIIVYNCFLQSIENTAVPLPNYLILYHSLTQNERCRARQLPGGLAAIDR